MPQLPKCKRKCGRTVPRPGMVCSVCRKSKRASSRSRSGGSRGGAASVLARDAMPVGHPEHPELVEGRSFSTNDIRRRWLRLTGRREESITDREYPTLFRLWSDTASNLNRYLSAAGQGARS